MAKYIVISDYLGKITEHQATWILNTYGIHECWKFLRKKCGLKKKLVNKLLLAIVNKLSK